MTSKPYLFKAYLHKYYSFKKNVKLDKQKGTFFAHDKSYGATK